MLILTGLLIGLGLMFFAWTIAMLFKNPSIVDVFWGITITCIGCVYLLQAPSTWQYLIMVLLILWASRLSGFLLLTRILKKKQDQRYTNMHQGWKNQKLGFLFNYLFQGILAWLIATSFYFSGQQVTPSPLFEISLMLYSIGLLGETLADFQLARYKKAPDGPVCRVGLWNYSRHPNYFFEFVIWLSFTGMALSNAQSLLATVSLLTIYSTMHFITIPITEKQSLANRGRAFEQYQAEVPCFFPRVS